MNATKPVAAIAAMLISFAGIGAITQYSNAAAKATRTDIHAVDADRPITTLPAIEVVPSREQLRQLSQPAGGGAAAATTGARMPYYSFAAEQVSA